MDPWFGGGIGYEWVGWGYGLSAGTAADRVSAMTQDEVNRIAGKIDSLPAGADSGAVLAAVIIIGLIVWLVWYKR